MYVIGKRERLIETRSFNDVNTFTKNEEGSRGRERREEGGRERRSKTGEREREGKEGGME